MAVRLLTERAARYGLAGQPLEPQDLGASIEVFENSKAARALVGDDLHRALIELKRSEWSRFTEAEGEFNSGHVSDWEGREYGDEF